MVQANAPLSNQPDAKPSVFVGEGRANGGRVFSPTVAHHRNTYGITCFVSRIYQFNKQNSLRFCRAGKNRYAVLFVFPESHSPKSFVVECGPCKCVFIQAKLHVAGIFAKAGIGRLDRHMSRRGPSHERICEFKRTVFYHFCIKTSVGAKVDVFKENSVHVGTYGIQLVTGVNCNVAFTRCLRR